MSSKKSNGKIIPLPLSAEKYIKTKARELPIFQCIINEDWKESRIASIHISRKQPSGKIVLASYLIDLKCLGLKDTFYNFNLESDELDKMLDKFNQSLVMINCPYVLAHNIIYGAIAFAEDIGLIPHKDWLVTQYALEDDTEDIELIDIEFGGPDGKPFLVITPHFSYVDAIARLDRKLGKGNYEIINDPIIPEKFNDDIENLVYDDEDYGDDDDFFGIEDSSKNRLVNYASLLIDKIYEIHCRYKHVTDPLSDISSINLSDYNLIEDEDFELGKFVTENEIKNLEVVYRLSESKPEKSLKKLVELVKNNPDNITYRNHLFIIYKATELDENADQLLIETYEKFPTHLFTRTNYAHFLLNKNRIDEFPAVFNGGVYDLNALYPEKKSFCYSEFCGFYNVIARFFAVCGQIKNAEFLTDMLYDLPETYEDDNIESTINLISNKKNIAIFGDMLKDSEDKILVKNPVFLNEVFINLYFWDTTIEKSVLTAILALPFDEFMADIYEGLHYSYLDYINKVKISDDAVASEFIMHAYFLMGEINRPEILEELLFILSSDYDLLFTFFGDSIFDKGWMPVYRHGKEHLDRLLEFCTNPEFGEGKSIVTYAMLQIAIQDPAYYEEVKKCFISIADYYIKNPYEADDQLDFISDFVGVMAKLGDTDFLPVIKTLYEKDFVDESYSGTYMEISAKIRSKSSLKLLEKLQSIFEIYDEINTEWSTS